MNNFKEFLDKLEPARKFNGNHECDRCGSVCLTAQEITEKDCIECSNIEDYQLDQ